MEELLKALYDRSLALDVNHVEAEALHGLQSGYRSLYTLGLLYPWKLAGVAETVPLHGRMRAIGWRLEVLARDGNLPLAERLGYAADLLGSYVMGVDTEFVERGLEIAWKLLYSRERGRLVLPCRTSGVCRLLCHCHYFTGDEECLRLAGGLVVEALGRSGTWDGTELLAWREALRLYDSVTGDVALPGVEGERLGEELRRLSAKARRVENGLVDAVRRGKGADDVVAFSRVFAVVAGRVLEDSVEVEGGRI